nr:DNA gyrase inhibitor YacG [Sulfurimicrobium lacus]
MVHCPTCGEAAPYSTSNPYRPFCSRRCKLIDLGQWANEEFRIPEAEKPLPDSE